jgi:large subunit ribosomal protein L10
LAGTTAADASKYLKGTPTGVVLGTDDPVAPAKITFEFLKDCQHIKIKGGVLDKKAISPAEAEALSKMPSREEMQAGIVATAMSPGRNLVSAVLSAGQRIAGVVAKRIEELERAAG